MLVKNLTGGKMFKHSVYDGNSRPCKKKKKKKVCRRYVFYIPKRV